MILAGKHHSLGREETSPLEIVLCGDVCRNEFREMVDDLVDLKKEYAFDLQFVSHSDLDKLNRFDMIFFFEDCPNRFSRKEIDALRLKMNLAVFVLIAGPLSEGSERTFGIIPGMARFYWYHWNTILRKGFIHYIRMVQERKANSNGNDLFHLQGMNVFEDYYLFSDRSDSGTLSAIFEDTDKGQTDEIIVVPADDRFFGAMLMDLIQQHGRSGKILTLTQALILEEPYPSMILIDSKDIRDPSFRKDLIDLSIRCTRSSLFLFAFAPDISDRKLYASTGNIRMIAKPFYY